MYRKNVASDDTNNEWLFINFNSQCLAIEKPASDFMASLIFFKYGIPRHRIVIEILEKRINDRDYLKKLIKYFRAMGLLNKH